MKGRFWRKPQTRATRLPPRAAAATLSALLGLVVAACGDGADAPRPVGPPNAEVAAMEEAGWITSDTVVSIDPQTFEETVNVRETDRSPDTLRDGTVVYQLTEYYPVFAGCADDPDPRLCSTLAVGEFVSANLEYPRWAQVRGLGGTAIATFVIGPDGRVSDTGIERSMGDEIDRNILRMIERMPVWHPGFHGGEPVAVRYRVPVTLTPPE